MVKKRRELIRTIFYTPKSKLMISCHMSYKPTIRANIVYPKVSNRHTITWNTMNIDENIRSNW